MLVGREEPLALLATLVARAREGTGQALLIEGEAGIGKSAMLDACADACREDGLVVLVGRGDELGATRPFAPLLDALAHGPHGDEARRTVRDRMVEERAPQLAVLESDPGIQSLLIDDLVNWVEELCVIQPVALFLDDLHWADASTLAALASLVRRAADLPLLMALATRRVPRGSDLAALIDLVDAAPASLPAARIELGPLDTDDVTELATRFLDASPGPGLRSLLEGCAGNPLLVVEMLASLREAGLLAGKDGGLDTAGDPGDLRLPTTLTETVRRRMARLDEKLQAIATVAALLGTRFTLTDLASITTRPATELFPLVQTLVEARLFTDDGEALSYRHDLVRQAVLSALPESVRVELHRGIATALQAAGAPTMRVAEQLALGATPGSTEAVPVLRAAAEEISQQDPAGAESLLRRALELCPPTDPERDLVSARLVDALAWGGRLNEAEAMAGEVLSRPVQPDAEIGLRSAVSRSLVLLARPHDALPHEERLIELHRAEGRSTAWPLAESAVCRVFGVDLDGAMREASEAVEQAEKDEDNAMALILGLSVQSFASTAFGDSASALELATRAATVADTTPGGEGHRLHPNLFRGIALQSLGRHTDARRALDRGRALGEALGSGWALPIYHFLAALAHWDRGEWDDLLTEIDAGLSHSEERAFSIGQAWAYGVAGRVRVHRGELDQATQLLDDGDKLIAERGAQFGVDWIVLARALLLETQGRRPEGLDLLRLVWETAVGLQASASLVLIGGDLARLAVDSGDEANGARVASELALLVERSPEDLVVRGRERRARGLVDRDASALREATEVFEQLGHRFEAALVRAELAELLLAGGETVEATGLFELSLSCYDDIGAAPEADRVRARLARLSPSTERRPAPRRAVTGWEALTPTEHEVVEEVCGGRSNPQVAERLGISRRTVEAHLRSVYAKIGVSTRVALAGAYRVPEPVRS
ncbi:MAG: helix-turn-helix transcriptional regulator [Actinomycetota bacterium]